MLRRFVIVIIAVVACHPILAGDDSLTLTQIQTALDHIDPRGKPKQDCAGRVTKSEAAEALFEGYLANGPVIEYSSLRAPYYSLLFDMVVLPELQDACTAATYYHRLYHELGHSTAASHRLDRNLTRADEEVVAELTAILLLRQVDLDIDYSHARSILDAYEFTAADVTRLWPEAVRAAAHITSGKDRSRATARFSSPTAF